MPKASEMLTANYPVGEPMVVYTEPKKSGPALIAAVATDSDRQTTHRGKKAEAVKRLYKRGKGLNKSQIAKKLKISRTSVIRLLANQ